MGVFELLRSQLSLAIFVLLSEAKGNKCPKLTLTRLLSEGPTAISKASAAISNPFWQSLWKLLPKLEKTFYSQHSTTIGERTVWDNDDFLTEGQPFNRRSNSRILTLNFNFIYDALRSTIQKSKQFKMLIEGQVRGV